jgi:hypothetical protein
MGFNVNLFTGTPNLRHTSLKQSGFCRQLKKISTNFPALSPNGIVRSRALNRRKF